MNRMGFNIRSGNPPPVCIPERSLEVMRGYREAQEAAIRKAIVEGIFGAIYQNYVEPKEMANEGIPNSELSNTNMCRQQKKEIYRLPGFVYLCLWPIGAVGTNRKS